MSTWSNLSRFLGEVPKEEFLWPAFYELPAEEAKDIPTVASSLEMALEALDNDREFLKAGGVMTDDMIDAYIDLKMEEVTTLRMTTHPVEFDMYYSV